MKKRLNLLCAIVLLVLSFSVLQTGYYSLMGAKIGFDAGYDAANADAAQSAKMQALANMQIVTVIPDVFGEDALNNMTRDSVFNVKSGKYVPAAHNMLYVYVNSGQGFKMRITMGVLSLLYLAFQIWALVLFIRLVISINRLSIFGWKNVRRLRLLGLMLIVAFGTQLLVAYINGQAVAEVFEMEGYLLRPFDAVRSLTLVLGLCSLIVGEVFAIGLKMKEEQDLTI
ncbi:MAG: DUF2975 domain-containing protein [Bacteroides sp.]|nr:DUF2975 domain-containing protein [Bacteroides sp.]